MGFTSPVSLTDRNTHMPFFPSDGWLLESADFGVTTLNAFIWIQGFYTVALSVPPTICVWSGGLHNDGSPILTQVEFAYSGDMKPIKGCAIFTSGTNSRGQAVTSCGIGGSPTTDFARLRVYGGMY